MVSCERCSEYNPCKECKDTNVANAWLALMQETPEEPLIQERIDIHPGCGRPIMECEC
jgi:hypothetical protein